MKKKYLVTEDVTPLMLRWMLMLDVNVKMCGITLRDMVPTVELRRRLGIEGVVEVETG